VHRPHPRSQVPMLAIRHAHDAPSSALVTVIERARRAGARGAAAPASRAVRMPTDDWRGSPPRA
jgi:hypothetical protein